MTKPYELLMEATASFYWDFQNSDKRLGIWTYGLMDGLFFGALHDRINLL